MATTTNEYSTMIAVFANYDQANQAIDNLRRAGYGYDRIRLVERSTSNFADNIKSLFSQVTATAASPDDWMRIGVPEQDAHHFQSELDAGRCIVLVKAVDNPEQALGILRQSGAYDLSSRLRTAPPAATPGTRNPSAAPGTAGAQPGVENTTQQAQPRQSAPGVEQNPSQ